MGCEQLPSGYEVDPAARTPRGMGVLICGAPGGRCGHLWLQPHRRGDDAARPLEGLVGCEGHPLPLLRLRWSTQVDLAIGPLQRALSEPVGEPCETMDAFRARRE